MNWVIIEQKIKDWLEEDINHGDVTSDLLIDEKLLCSANLIAKENGVIAGIEVMKRVFKILDQEIVIFKDVKDGQRVQKGEIIATLEGPALSILKGERLVLNLLQRMSGIATETAKYVELIKDLNVRLVDTRKTIPGMRILDKYAVRVGGAHNHRHNLSDGVMIKDNHIAASGSITKAIEKTRKNIPHTLKIEVEVENLAQMEEAIQAGADIILLDNMSVEMLKEAVKRNQGKVLLEASGNVSLYNIREIAETGVDVISVGSLTHSVKALDLSLKVASS